MTMVIIVLLLGIVMALSKFESEVVQLEQTQLGKTFLDTVQIALQTKEPLDRVFQILRDQEKYYEDEFNKMDERHSQTQCKCSKDLGDFDNMISLLKMRVLDMQTALDDKQPDKLKKLQLLQSKKKDKSTVLGRIEDLKITRSKQQCMYESRMEYNLQLFREHHVAISAVVAVRKIFESAADVTKPEQFIQMSEDDIDKVQALLSYADSKSSDFKELQGYTSLFAILEQLQVDQIGKHLESVQKVVSMSLSLEDYIDHTRTLLRSVDDIRGQYFQRLFDALSQNLRDLNTDIDQLDTEVQSLEAQIRVLQMDVDEVSHKLDMKSKQRLDRGAECEQESNVYAVRIVENQRERETIQRTLNLCMDNVKELKQYIRRRGDDYYKK